MKNVAILGAVVAFFMVTPAFGVGLTDADYDYLATQDVVRGSPVLNALSPRERSRLHALINDPGTDNNPPARATTVRGVLIEFESNQNWEKMNPGQLWDSPERGRRPID